MVRPFGLKEAKGPAAIFSPQGKIALMFLKHYAGRSDKKLIEGLNGNLDWQFFCGTSLGTDRLKNHKIVGDVRCELADKLDIGTGTAPNPSAKPENMRKTVAWTKYIVMIWTVGRLRL